MKVLVDTSVWSLALKRGTPKDSETIRELTDLIRDVRVQIIGPIRQELLSGLKTKKQFAKLKSYLNAFPDLPLQTADLEKAAEFFNTSRSQGVEGSNTDFLICAVAYHRGWEIFAVDRDFESFRSCLPIRLYSLASAAGRDSKDRGGGTV